MSSRSNGPLGADPSPSKSVAIGRAARARVAPGAYGDLDDGADRDPVGLVLGQAATRVPELVPIRHGRMLASPFSYYRGAALPMAADLGRSPSSGLRVQLCGDAHLSNFGAYASPERRLVFDVNDFDETLPGPFEWVVKRLVASLEVAGRQNGFRPKQRRRIAEGAARTYRTSMREFARRSVTDVWYAHLEIEPAIKKFTATLSPKRAKAMRALVAKARRRDSMQALSKLTVVVDGERRFRDDPPLLVPAEEVFADVGVDELHEAIRRMIAGYRRTLQPDRRHLLDEFVLTRVARKIVGVGSVGTRAWVLLMESLDGMEPLFLQAKEAERSVLADYSGRSRLTNEGQRVVEGQHLIQASSDIFLGWQRVRGADGVDRDFYLRQLRDWKFSLPVEQMVPAGMARYAELCAWTLARAHARSGDRIAISAYLGKSDRFDGAVARFAAAYADLNERDFAAFCEAVDAGRIEATRDV